MLRLPPAIIYDGPRTPVGVERRYSWHRKPIFARSCRSAQSGSPTAPREVHLPLLPHGPSGVHRHLPRRTRLRRSAGPEENRPVLLTFHDHLLTVPRNGSIQVAEHPHFTRMAGNCQAKFDTYKPNTIDLLGELSSLKPSSWLSRALSENQPSLEAKRRAN